MIESRAVSSEKIANLYSEYIWVKLQATAGADHKAIEPKRGGMLIMFAPDGTRLGDFDIKKADVDAAIDEITKAHAKVQEKYGVKETAWAEGSATSDSNGKIVAYMFADDKEASVNSLKAFDDRWVNWKTMEKVVPVKVTDLAGDLAKRFKVASAPTLVIVNPAAEESKQVLDRKTGEISARTLKKTLDKAIETVEKKK